MTDDLIMLILGLILGTIGMYILMEVSTHWLWITLGR